MAHFRVQRLHVRSGDDGENTRELACSQVSLGGGSILWCAPKGADEWWIEDEWGDDTRGLSY